MFPDNIVAASFQQVQSDYETKPVYYITSNFTGEVTKLKLVFTPGMNVLGMFWVYGIVIMFMS